MVKLTTEQFIEKAKTLHGNKYNYSDVRYSLSNNPIVILCHKHGAFKQTPSQHLFGSGCPSCGQISGHDKQRKTFDEFLVLARNHHENKYDYSKTVIRSKNDLIIIGCPIHGEFLQRRGCHQRGTGCPQCYGDQVAKRLLKSTTEFISAALTVHGTQYSYSSVDYQGTHLNIKIRCPKHGIFLQTPHNHLIGCGCPNCQTSKGEKQIQQCLIRCNYSFEQQKMFDGCRNPRTTRMLKFDFWVPKHNALIEYDGQQHFSCGIIAGRHYLTEKDLAYTRYKDDVKNEFCRKHNFPLLRIPYWRKNKIPLLIESFFEQFH